VSIQKIEISHTADPLKEDEPELSICFTSSLTYILVPLFMCFTSVHLTSALSYVCLSLLQNMHFPGNEHCYQSSSSYSLVNFYVVLVLISHIDTLHSSKLLGSKMLGTLRFTQLMTCAFVRTQPEFTHTQKDKPTRPKSQIQTFVNL
jgi:hypothetical protein